MPAAFQKVMDYTLFGLDNTHCFLDDIIVVSRRSNEDHLELVYKCLKNEDNLNKKLYLSATSLKQKKMIGFQIYSIWNCTTCD